MTTTLPGNHTPLAVHVGVSIQHHGLTFLALRPPDAAAADSARTIGLHE